LKTENKTSKPEKNNLLEEMGFAPDFTGCPFEQMFKEAQSS
jgi:hypothetical protein